MQETTMEPLKIGISACIFHKDPGRITFNGRPLIYLEESMPHFVMAKGALAFMIPTIQNPTKQKWQQFAQALDGVVFSGGVDMAPESYGQTPKHPDWRGDPIRDQYEMDIFHAFRQEQKPVLGICRGMQMINVALGGTLHQDIKDYDPKALTHRDAKLYETNQHQIDIVPGSSLEDLFHCRQGVVNSVHHQAIDKLAEGLVVEATSTQDQIIEAVTYTPQQSTHTGGYCKGVQWHPEFMKINDRSLLDPLVILDDFLKAVRLKKQHYEHLFDRFGCDNSKPSICDK